MHTPLQNPYKRKPTVSIQPFANHPEFKIVHIKGTRVIRFLPADVLVVVEFDERTNIARNICFAPNDWSHYKTHYFKYLPCWSDIVVGGSNWRNNTHAELSNRRKKTLIKQRNNGQAMKINEYIHSVLCMNMGLQKYFVIQMRQNHADTVSKLSGFEDKWMKRHSNGPKAVYTKQCQDLCNLYKKWREWKGITSLNEVQSRQVLNTDFKVWQSKLKHASVRNLNVSFSRQVVKHLQNRYELPQIGERKKEIFGFFFKCVLPKQTETHVQTGTDEMMRDDSWALLDPEDCE